MSEITGLKIVITVTGARASIGVQEGGADPVIEAFDGLGLAEVLDEVPGVLHGARVHWESSATYPVYERQGDGSAGASEEPGALELDGQGEPESGGGSSLDLFDVTVDSEAGGQQGGLELF